MLDFARVDPRAADAIVLVVDEMTRLSGVERSRLMIVGAEARNILHAAQGHAFPLRGTTDLDVAVLMNDWPAFEELEARAESTGDTGIRFVLAGIVVDVMPFGRVEEPRGTVVPRRRGEPLDVFGFEEVFTGAMDLNVADLSAVRIPTQAGYVALKLKAWADRSAGYEYKDADDIATAMFWYQESPTVHGRLYGADGDHDLLIGFDLDVDLAAGTLLGRDIRALIGAPLSRELAGYVASTVDVLALAMTGRGIPGWSTDPARRRALLAAMLDGLGEE